MKWLWKCLGPILLLMCVCAHAASSVRARLTLDDILSFERLSDVQISPDGSSVLYVLVKPGPRNVYGETSAIWFMDVRSRHAYPLLAAAGSPTIASDHPRPRWSPDGRYVAYLSAAGAGMEVWLAEVSSGIVRQLTGLGEGYGTVETHGSVSEFAFDPQGERMVYVRNLPGVPSRKHFESMKVISVAEQPYYLSPEGPDGGSTAATYLEIVDIASGQAERATERLPGASQLSWSPDGRQVLYIPYRAVWGGARASAVHPTILDIGTGESRVVTQTPGADRMPAWSPDQTSIAFISHVQARFGFSRQRSLYTAPAKGGAPRLISGDDISVWYGQQVAWTRNDGIYFASRSRATTRLFALSADGHRRAITPEHFHVSQYSLSADGSHMAVILEDANTPPEVYVGDPRSGRFDKLTDLGLPIRSKGLGQVEMVKWRSADDRFDVEGFLVKPPGFKPDQRYPLLVNMHGGPAAVYENRFSDINFKSSYHTPAALYAQHGYLVLLPNKRGDEGYGAEFIEAHYDRFGDDVEYDMMAGVDALIARGIADSEQLGVMGHSYGAYAVAWAMGHTDRFKAASLSDGPVNLLSYYGQAYLTNHAWMKHYLGGSPVQARERYIDRSPIRYAKNMRTPALLRYGNRNGLIQPTAMLAQGMELYSALHEQGVPVDLLIHQKEGHVVQDEEAYRDYVARNLAWFNRWVLGR